MDKISLWDVVKFCLRNPSLLMSVIQYRHDKCVDKLIEYLIDNINGVKVIQRNAYYLCLTVQGCLYEFWRTNRYYAYLTIGKGAPIDKGGICYTVTKRLWDGKRPSLKHAVAFYQYLDGPYNDETVPLDLTPSALHGQKESAE